MRFFFALCFILGIATGSEAQIVVTTNPDTNQIRNQLQGSGVQIYNLSLFADSVSFGLFQGNSELPITNGFAITSGNVQDMSGHSDSVFADIVLGHNNFSGWSETIDVDTGAVYDYARFSFSVIPVGDTLVIGFCFASEEYLRYNDVGAVMITGPNPAGGSYDSLRLSWVGSPNFPLCIMNCNQLNWQQYFIPYWTIPAQYESYRGGTVYFERQVAVVPGQPYYVSLSVADATDGNYDSALLVEGIWSDNTLSIDGPHETSVNVFPNPTSELLTVNLGSYAGVRDLIITNELGQVVWQTQTEENVVSIQCSDFADGMYFLQVIDATGTISTVKFTVMK